MGVHSKLTRVRLAQASAGTAVQNTVQNAVFATAPARGGQSNWSPDNGC